MQVTSLVDGIQCKENCHGAAAQLLLGKIIDLQALEGLEDVAMVEVWSDQVDELIVNHVFF